MTFKKWILFVSSFFLFLASCKEKKGDVQIQHPQETLRDTLIVNDTIYFPDPYPVPYVKDSLIYIESAINVDTLAILNMFAQKTVRVDTLSFDFGYLIVIDTLKGNIVSRNYFAKTKLPQTKEKIKIIEEEPKDKYYIGTNFGFDRPNYVYHLGTSILYQTKNDKIYEIGIGVRNQVLDGNRGIFVPSVHGGVYWKLKNKK